MASIKPYDAAAGRRWRVQYVSPDGRHRTKQGFKRKADAQAWADQNATLARSGEWVDQATQKRPVGDYHKLWDARLDKRAEGTRRVYRPCWEQHVAPVWENVPVSSIRPSEVQAWVDQQTVGAVMVKRMANILAQILDIALKDGAIRSNPARGLDLPRKPQPKQVYLTAEQLATLAGEAKYPEIVWLMGTVGLRWGELAGLRVRCVNVLRSRLLIEEAATTNGGSVDVGETKTHEKREVVVPRFVMEMLEPLLEGKAPDDWVWQRENGQPMRRPTSEMGWFDGAVTRCMETDSSFPRVTLHGLRHVAAGLMVSSGANVKVIQKQLGHKSAVMTLDIYAALFEDDLEALGCRMEESFSSVRGKFVES
ncbi:MAG: site-specific integrase [Corynebacterium glucuronolyticum]|nr:site-specific integrase [Mycobacteriaceae bacterium]MDY5834654.1 site-specific integrase [Corynebacterium glucuronolyticum]